MDRQTDKQKANTIPPSLFYLKKRSDNYVTAQYQYLTYRPDTEVKDVCKVKVVFYVGLHFFPLI